MSSSINAASQNQAKGCCELWTEMGRRQHTEVET